jgi:hypothetical protein
MGIGRTVLPSGTGEDIQVIASGDPLWMRSGATFDWGTVAAVAGAPVTTPGGLVVPVGQKWLRFGQVMTKITNPTVITATVTGGATGGSLAITGTRPDNNAIGTQTLAFNANLAAIQAALDLIYGAGNTLAAGTLASFTVTGQGSLTWETIAPFTIATAGLTGGTPASTVTATNAGGNTGKFGPFDPAAADGRQTLARSNVGILNRTILQGGVLNGVYTVRDTDHSGLLVGGQLFKARVLHSGVAAASLAAGPTLAALEAALPLVQWTTN